MTRAIRADAQDNRDRMVTAARSLFAERGLDVGMREIARRAQVGPATLYRRFPTRQDLVDEAFAVELQSCRGIVEDGCADEDPWHGFTSVIERLTALNVRNRGFVDAFMSADPAADLFAEHRRELLGLLEDLGHRAQAARKLRRDFVIDDLILILLAGRGLSAVNDSARDASARRFAVLAIDGLRARVSVTSRAGTPQPQLPSEPSSVHDG